MREVELKAVVPDVVALRARLGDAHATMVFAGTLRDRRYDTADRALTLADRVLRLREYRARGGAGRAVLDMKGPTELDGGYKSREEHSTDVGDAAALHAGLELLGYHLVREIDRDIEQFALEGASVRIEQYPRLDVLVEVEGTPETIERAIAVTGIARHAFTTHRLPDFVMAFEARTGTRAALCARELEGDYRYRELAG